MVEKDRNNIVPFYSENSNLVSSNDRMFSSFGNLSFLESLQNQNYLDVFPDNIEEELLTNVGLYQIDGLVLSRAEYQFLSVLVFPNEAIENNELQTLNTELLSSKQKVITDLISSSREELTKIEYISENQWLQDKKRNYRKNKKEAFEYTKISILNLFDIIAESNQWNEQRKFLSKQLLTFQLSMQDDPKNLLIQDLSKINCRYLKYKMGLLSNLYRGLEIKKHF